MSQIVSYISLVLLLFSNPNIDSLIIVDSDNEITTLDSTSYFRKIRIANHYISLGEIKEAQRRLDEISILLSTSDSTLQANYYTNIVRFYGIQKQFTKAEAAVRKAIILNSKLNNAKGVAMGYYNLANILMFQSKLDSSIIYYQKCLPHFKDTNNKNALTQVYNSLGTLFRKNKDFEKALEYNSLTINQSKRLQAENRLADGYSNRAIILHDLNIEDSVLIYQEKAYALYEKIGDLANMARQAGNIGAVYRRNKQLDKAEIFLEKAMSLYNKTENPGPTVNILLSLGRVKTEKGQHGESLELLAKAQTLVDPSDLEMQMEIKTAQGESLEGLHKYKQSAEAFQQAKLLSDSLESLKNKEILYEKEVKYQAEARQDSIISLRNKTSLALQKVSKLNYFIGLLAIVLIPLSIAFFMLKSKSKSANIKYLNTEKEKELLLFNKMELEKINQKLKSKLKQTEINRPQTENRHLNLEKKHKIHILPIQNIEYIITENNGIRIFKSDNTSIWLDNKLKSLIELNPNQFLRTHKQFAVNTRHITSISNNTITLYSGQSIPIGRTYKRDVKASFSDSCF